ncbi:MAG: RagB/SusD family nutrient uptake outer membrane protein [Bacteroidota bacterium]
MKRYFNISRLVALLGLMTLACSDDFLNRPPQDSYVVDAWYETDQQLELAVNPLYGGVWFDYQRSWLNIGDVMAGNFHKGDEDAFYTFSVNQATTGVRDAYASLWMAVAYANSVVENIIEKTGPKVTETAKNTALGEALVWKSMAYFYLVRGWGAMPIIESNSALITSGQANTVYRNRTEDVYEYIVRMLTKAGELLPAVNKPGRINKYSAYGLLAKVYLTRSGYGQTGSRKQEDLDNAKVFAGKVINESGLVLEPEYGNLFNINPNKGNRNPENLISWHWQASKDWGTQNAIQADLAVQQLTGFGDGWGTWSGPSIFLQSLFGEDATKIGAANRVTTDKRRKTTLMMDGDYYAELKRDAGGLSVKWDGGAIYASPSGAWARKHIVGNKADNDAEGGGFIDFMKTSLSTHILRLSDVYLVYAEAVLGNSSSTSDAEALKAYNTVRKRAIPTHVDVASVSFDDIFKERIRELAFEGDNWFDYVRLYYYKPADAIGLLSDQQRGWYSGNASAGPVVLNSKKYTPAASDFFLPIPEVDIIKNPNLLKDPVAFDFSLLKY